NRNSGSVPLPDDQYATRTHHGSDGSLPLPARLPHHPADKSYSLQSGVVYPIADRYLLSYLYRTQYFSKSYTSSRYLLYKANIVRSFHDYRISPASSYGVPRTGLHPER